MKCAECQQSIGGPRLRALMKGTIPRNGRLLCIDCKRQDDDPKSVGIMIWDHKTAPYIEINTITAVQQAGKKHRFGPHFQLTAKEGIYGVAKSMQEAQQLHELAERLRREKRGLPDPDEGLAPLLLYPSRCHPDRPRIGPTGYCLECSLMKQAQRIRR